MKVANLTKTEIEALSDTKTNTEWCIICEEIYTARDGEMPPDWDEKISFSGISAQKIRDFSKKT